MNPTRANGWRRRLPFYLLVCGMAVLVAQYFGRQPVDVQVVYHYAALSAGLKEVSLNYHNAAGELVQRTRFRYSARRAEPTQRHTLRLPRGQYRVAIDLHYERPEQALDVARRLAREPSDSDATVALVRPLTVHAPGELSIYLE